MAVKFDPSMIWTGTVLVLLLLALIGLISEHEAVMKRIHELLSGKDGKTWDIGRVSWVATTFAIIAAYWYKNYVDPKDTSILQFAEALAANTAAHGFALGFKKQTEPDPGTPG